jgi:predicted PurR-regulated permease PerM
MESGTSVERSVREPRLPPLTHYAKATAVVIAVGVAAVLLYQIRSVVLSIFLGFFVAVGSEPFVRWLERRGLRRGAAVAVFVLSALLVLAGLTALMLYPAIRQAGQLVQSVPDLLDQATVQAERFGIRFDDPEVQERLRSILEKAPSLLASSIGTIYGVLGGVFSALFTTLTVIVLAVYFMVELPRMRAFAAKALRLPERAEVMEQSMARVGAYVTGQIVVSLTAGVFSGVVLAILGVPYAAVLGVAVAICSAIPQVGAMIGAVLCTVVALTESIAVALITLAVLLAYQQFENYVLAPRVFARAVDLSPVAVFIAVLVGAGAAGAIGAVTALPLAAALKVVFRYLFRRQLGRMEQPVAESAPDPAGGDR